MATGVLVLGVGRATKLLTYVVGADKDYDATIRLGAATTTEDAEGEVLSRADASAVVRADLDAGIAGLTGEILQVPSTVSAIKVDGQRAYARARAGEEVALAARPVVVSRFDVLAVRPVAPGEQGLPDDAPPALDVDVTVTVSSGTYVRALARDLGSALGVGGHLTALRRTRVGGYGLDVASTLEELEAQADRDGVLATLPLAQAARATFPVRELTPEQATALSYGQWVDATGTPGTTAAISPTGELVRRWWRTPPPRRQGPRSAGPGARFPPDASGSASCPGRGSLVQRGPGASPPGPPPPVGTGGRPGRHPRPSCSPGGVVACTCGRT